MHLLQSPVTSWPMTRRGMTVEEREVLVIEMALRCPAIIFEYSTLSDESLALRIQYGPEQHQWMTIRNADDWHTPRIPALQRAIADALAYAESLQRIASKGA